MSTEGLVEDWSRRLGLASTSLFDASRQLPSHFAMLDGVEGSFALSTEGNTPVTESLDWTWSANLASHVDIAGENVLVRQVDPRAQTLRFSRDQVDRNLEKFFDTMVANRMAPPVSVSDHIVYCFRSHRQTAASTGLDSAQGLQTFLAMLKGVMTGTQPDLDPRLPVDHFHRFEEELRYNRLTRRTLDMPLTMRNAAGMVFQEAHAELTSQTLEPLQPQLFGLAPAPSQSTRNRLGAYYTPPGLARVLSDLAVRPHLDKARVTIMDPACGSGIFLTEVIHALQRRRYRGQVQLVGFDLSPAAVEMARFAVGFAAQGASNLSFQIDVADFTANVVAPKADVVLMNPPFIPFPDLSSSQQATARAILGEAFGYRPDLSMVFITRALTMLEQGGTLASLLPSGVFEQTNGQGWRKAILEASAPDLFAILGDHGLFRDAVVNIAAVVLQKTADPLRSPTMVWASQKRGASSAALRRLRRWEDGARRPERNADWAIYQALPEQVVGGKDWTPRPNSLGSLPLKLATTPHVRKVGDLFQVELGIRVGNLSDRIQISAQQFEDLHPSERRLFRPVAETKSIRMGRILPVSYLLYPEKPLSIAEVQDRAPRFFARHLADIAEQDQTLEPARARRRTNLEAGPKIVSRAFLGPGSFAFDPAGEHVVVQGYAWLAKAPILTSPFDAASLMRDYCYLLNSRLFFALLRENGRLVGGGQVDGAKRHMQDVPIPDLAAMYEAYPSLLSHALMLRKIEAEEFPDMPTLDAFAAAAYQTTLEEWSQPQ